MSNIMKPFPNPPIIEAIFNIGTVLPKETTLEVLSSYQDVIDKSFSKKTSRRKMEGGFQFIEGSQPKILTPKDEVYGYHFISDKAKIVQARLDGFTFKPRQQNLWVNVGVGKFPS